MPLEHKRILITGAARRVGRSLAVSLAQAGADLVIHYGKSQAQAEALKAEISSMGREASLFSADLNDPHQVTRFIDQVFASGPIFGLINNASLFGNKAWNETTLDDWNQHIQVNLTTPFLLCQAFARNILPEGEGRIINMLDWRALRPGADHVAYTISKAGLAALTKSLAQALAPQITVNGIALGAILPPVGGEEVSHILDWVPVGRWADLEEVNQVVKFLMDGPNYITGEIIHLDGGRHLV